ncbi:hypothetical protein N7456_011118 [Penicillium angulare]|uniref:Retrotransposon gag domain-containing protein n=1 Tax=Penicillium angulare TaxID=116970 RepID=A0A9W9ET10_9EURO|nr:hypothetical protein N7456_011118 [Penicillium angulare]
MPTFSGGREENVNMYLRACKSMWIHLHPSGNIPRYSEIGYSDLKAYAAIWKFNEACATQAYNGTKGEARAYVNQFDDRILSDWETLQSKLKERFPWSPRPEESESLSTRIFNLKQGVNTLMDYIEETKSIKAAIGKDKVLAVMLHLFWIRGLANETARDTLWYEFGILMSNREPPEHILLNTL